MDEKVFGEMVDFVERVNAPEMDDSEIKRIESEVEKLYKQVAACEKAVEDAEAALDATERNLSEALSELPY